MPRETSPTARALLTLELVQSYPGITADRLAERLGVTERAARRYVGILREAGLPIESHRGPHGGYHLGRGLRLPPLMFTADEALGLVMAVLDGHHEAGDPADPVGNALGKLVRALPEPVATQAAAVRRSAAPAPDRGAARPEPRTASTLVQASADRHRVRFTYRSEAGREWTTEAEPWAVVVRHGRWYLLCRVVEKDAIRAYRIDRVRDTEVLPIRYTRPETLDPVALLEEHLSMGWDYEVEVVIEAQKATVAAHLPGALGRLTEGPGGTTTLTGTTSNPTWYATQLALIPAPYRIVRSPELRAAAEALGRRLLDAAQ